MSARPGPAHLPLAVDRNGELHDTVAIESAPASLVPPLRCADCGAPLEAVRAHPRRERATIVHVAAHYRLAPGAAHTITCPWGTQPPSPAAAARSGSRPKAAPLVYSLVVPSRSDTQSLVWRSRSYRRSRGPALNSAAKVADVLTRHGNHATAIRLDYLGRPISWNDFLFTCADTSRLAQLIQQGRPGHPVAVVGRLGDRKAARSGSTCFAVLSDPFATSGSRACDVRVVLRSSNEQLLSNEREAVLVVAFGWWQLHSPARHVHPDAVVLWVNRGWQISPCREGAVAYGSPPPLVDGICGLAYGLA